MEKSNKINKGYTARFGEGYKTVGNEKSCFFTGHRDTTDTVMPLLLETIERHITEYGVTTFYVVHYGAFDHMAGVALTQLKKLYPHITAHLVLAYHPAVRRIEAPKGLDGSIFMDEQEKSLPKYAIINLNRRMVREVDYLIAFVRYITGGSYKLMEYAMSQEKKGRLVITNLADTPDYRN